MGKGQMIGIGAAVVIGIIVAAYLYKKVKERAGSGATNRLAEGNNEWEALGGGGTSKQNQNTQGKIKRVGPTDSKWCWDDVAKKRVLCAGNVL